MKSAPSRAAALLRLALPARSTDAGETRPRASEAVHRGDNDAGAAERLADAAGIADIPADGFHSRADEVFGAVWVAGQHPNGKILAGQQRNQPGAEQAGAAGDDDHRRDPAPASGSCPAPAPACWRTAALTSAPPASTASR